MADIDVSEQKIISGIEDTDEVGPFSEFEDESMAFPQEYTELGGPFNNSEDVVRNVRETVRRVKDYTAKWDQKRRRVKTISRIVMNSKKRLQSGSLLR